MNQLKCLVVDDEPLACEVLEKYIADCPGLHCKGTLASALEAMTFLNEHKVDILFLDINMPKLSGLNFLENLTSRPLTILTTAYPEFALQGYELNVVDYLLKPISFERFLKAVEKVRERQGQGQEIDKTISLKADKKIYRLEPGDIIYLEGLGDYLKVYTAREDKPLIVQETMKHMLHVLGRGFMRIHKSYIINKDHSYQLDGNELVISNGDRLPVGYSYRKMVIDFMGGHGEFKVH